MDGISNQIDLALRRWYKSFGVDYVFHTVDSTVCNLPLQQLPQRPLHEPFGTTLLNCETLNDLKEAVLGLDCPLKKMARNTVFSDGTPGADVMIIGEAPGQEEDTQGKPFVGQSGQLLNNMLCAIGIRRQDVYISNVVFWRPPGNRTPTSDEISFCMPYMETHIKLAKPKALLLLGGVAVRTILNTVEPIARIRGIVHTYHGIKVIATYHPAYLLRSPTQKHLVFQDLLLLKKTLR
jgi:DNA polymerase